MKVLPSGIGDLELVVERQRGAVELGLEHAVGVDLLGGDRLGAARRRTATRSADGRKARTTTPPFDGWAPSTEWGSASRPPTSWSSTSVTD